MRRKLLSVSAVLLTIALVFIIAVCVSCCPGNNPSDDSNPQGLEFVLQDEGTYLVSIGSANYLEKIEIPAYYKGEKVTDIGLFGSDSVNANLKEVVLPDTIVRISESAFKNCVGLTSISIPESVEEIGISAFDGCYKLVEVINKSALNLTAGSPDHGSIAKYAKEVHSGDTKIVKEGDYLFYTANGVNYLLGFAKNISDVSLPTGYNGGSYEIYNYAFYGSGSVKTVKISGGVKAIGNYAFKGCSRLSDVTVGTSVETMGESAFEGCNTLSSITLPFVGSARISAFNNFGYIFGARSYNSQSGSIPASLKTVKIIGATDIKANAFNGCSGITTVVLGDEIRTIGKNAFAGCTKLSSVTFGSALSDIGEGAFASTALASVALPDSVQKIGDGAFKSCSKLSSITFGKSIKSIGKSALEGCTSISSITIPFVGASVGGDSGSYFGHIFGAADYNTQSAYIPEALVSVKVTGKTGIPAYAFYGCSKLQSVEIDGEVASIGDWAFYGCSALSNVNIGGKVSSIGFRAFENCVALANVVIPDSVTTIGNGAFYSCTGLKSISLPKGLTTIEAFAFWECPIDTVYVDDLVAWCGVTLENPTSNPMNNGAALYVSDSIVENLDVSSLVPSSNLTEIKNYTFYGCSSIKSVKIPDTVKTIGDSAFAGCKNITTLKLGKAVETIGNSAFENCAKIVTVEIGESVNSIGTSAFANCYRLVEVINKSALKVTVGSSNIGGIAYYALEVHTGGTKIVKDGDYLFYTCGGVDYLVGYSTDATNITLPASYKNNKYSINRYAFYGCSELTEVVVPAGVTSIGRGAFGACDNLTGITLPFVGTAAASDKNTHFGYIFDAAYTDTYNSVQNDYIPASLKTVILTGGQKIAAKAFYSCSGIEKVVIPASVTFVGISAFEGCTSLADLTLPFVGETKDAKTNTYLGFIFGASSYSTQSELVPASLKTITFTGRTEVSKYAFFSCAGIEKVVLPDTVTAIGAHAFQGCSGLKTVEIGSGVKTVGTQAFYGCTALTAIVLPEGLTTIEVMAFENCTGLTSVVVPNSVIGIGASAFKNCSSLESISLPLVGGIGDSQNDRYFGHFFGAAAYNSQKSSIPSSLKTVIITGGSQIADYMFFECESIEKIELPNSVLTIGYMSFFNCKALSSVSIGSKVTSIGSKAFLDCSGLQSIVVPDSVQSIGVSAFEGCSALTAITVPFVGNAKTATENTHFGYIFGAYLYDDQNTYIPASLKTVVITGGSSIAPYAFYNCAGVVDVDISGGVSIIGDHAFIGCTELARVVIGDSVLVIDASAFKSCAKLAEVVLGNSLQSIGTSAFEGCEALVSIRVPNSTKTIGENAFKSCAKLVELVLGNSLETIGVSAFENCVALVSVEVPDSVGSIGASAFAGCKILESIRLPFIGATANRDENTYLGYVFGASNYDKHKDHIPASLRTVVITGGTSIAANDFYECSALTTIEIIGDVRVIGESAFVDCTGLTRLVIGDNVITIGKDAFKSCAQLTEVVLGKSVQTIAESAFDGCVKLASINLPASLRSIGANAFNNCQALTEVVVPVGVTSMGKSAFAGCTALKSIELPFLGNVATINANSFLGYIFGASGYDTQKAHVPASLESVKLSAGTTVASYAFNECSSLKSIELPSGVKTIGVMAFYKCTGLESFVIPAGVTKIDSKVFSGCSSLESITIPAAVTYIGYDAFSQCSGLKSVVIPSAVKTVGDFAFQGCSAIENVYYTGSETQWKSLYIGTYNNDMLNANIVYNYKSGN